MSLLCVGMLLVLTMSANSSSGSRHASISRTVAAFVPAGSSLAGTTAIAGTAALPTTPVPVATSQTVSTTDAETIATYSASMLPTSVQAGMATPATVTLVNNVAGRNDEGSTLYIASATVTLSGVPRSAVGIGAASPGWNAAFSTGSAAAVVVLTPTSAGAYIGPGGSLSLDLTVTVPVGDINQFTVTTGVTPSSSNTDSDNDDNFAPAAPITVSVVQPPYTLSFSAMPPTFVQESNSFCTSVQLEQNGAAAHVAGIPVTVTGIAAPGYSVLPVLTGTTAADTNASGIASFGTCGSKPMSIGNVGTFELQAASPNAKGTATSSSFTVVQSLTSCYSACSVTLTSQLTGVSTTINASKQNTPFELAASFGEPANLGCLSQVNPGPWDPLFVGASSGVSGTVTLTFPKAIVNTQSNSGRPHMQICAVSVPTEPFQAENGSASTDGLVTDCVNGTFPYSLATYPLGLCVLSRTKGSLGHETVVVAASDLSDPSFW